MCVCESDKACVSRALEARNLEAAAVWFTPLGRGSLFRLPVHLDRAAYTFCRQSGDVQLCGVCVVSPAQGTGPLGNQAQMERKPSVLKSQTLSFFVRLACGWMCLHRARMLDNRSYSNLLSRPRP